MNRLPSLFRRMPPSPRTASVTSEARTPAARPCPSGGTGRNVDEVRAGLVRQGMAVAEYSHEFDVTL